MTSPPKRWESQDTSRLKELSARLQSEQFSSWPTPDRFETYDVLHRASVALAAFAALTQEHEKLKQAHETLMFRLEANTNAGFSLPAVEAALAALKGQTCEWKPDDDGIYHTGCGHTFFFDTDGPLENQQKFCGYCGATLKADPWIHS